MTTEFALAYIQRRMEDLGHQNNYLLKFRHLVLKPLQNLEIEAYNQLFLLVEEPNDLSIQSALGIFNLIEDNTNEMIYEHQGLIKISNYSNLKNHVKFIQVIPKYITEKCQ